MKKFYLLLGFVLLLSSLLPSCSAGIQAPVDPMKNTSVKTEAETKSKVTQTQETTEENPAIMQEYDPAEDDILNVLMIGNSYCYYYVEELFGMAKAAGIPMKVCNLYYSGCPLDKHWTWWTQNEAGYQYFETDDRGRQKYENYTLRRALERENWGVITLQEGNGSYRRNGIEGIRKEIEPLGKLLDVIKEQFPKSQYYWHCTWVPQVGNYNASSDFRIESKEDEMAWQDAKITIAKEIKEKYSLPFIPTGQAWADARYNPVIANQLCLREAKPDDTSHDGDVGGGQYLNACVWFEVLTGQSCIGNSYRPDYKLSEEKIAILQQAAHKAVAAERG